MLSDANEVTTPKVVTTAFHHNPTRVKRERRNRHEETALSGGSLLIRSRVIRYPTTTRRGISFRTLSLCGRHGVDYTIDLCFYNEHGVIPTFFT